MSKRRIAAARAASETRLTSDSAAGAQRNALVGIWLSCECELVVAGRLLYPKRWQP